ncbi:hypothetical protein EMIT0P74_10133 [Pseudomonas sp. IT-P74]
MAYSCELLALPALLQQALAVVAEFFEGDQLVRHQVGDDLLNQNAVAGRAIWMLKTIQRFVDEDVRAH